MSNPARIASPLVAYTPSASILGGKNAIEPKYLVGGAPIQTLTSTGAITATHPLTTLNPGAATTYTIDADLLVLGQVKTIRNISATSGATATITAAAGTTILSGVTNVSSSGIELAITHGVVTLIKVADDVLQVIDLK